MHKKTYPWLVVLSLVMGCGLDTSEILLPKVKLTIRHSADKANDSLFFKNIKCLTYVTDGVIGSESDQAQIFLFSHELKFQYIIGRQGKGPLELGTADYFAVSGDTIIIRDGENNRMQFFTESGRHIIRSSDPVSEFPSALSGRFIYNNGKITASARNTAALARFDLNHVTPFEYFGTRYPFSSTKQESIRNDRHVLGYSNGIITVSDNMPNIECYDQTGRLRAKCDFSSIEPVKRQIAYIDQQKLDERSYFTLIVDCSLSENHLWILVGTNFEGYLVNNVLEFELSNDTILPVRLLQLPGKIYSSITVGKNTFYAFNSESSCLESFAL